LSAFNFPVHFRELGDDDMCLQKIQPKKTKKPFKTMSCKAREPLSEKAITWGSRG
jgi:hypothetical protein